VLVTRGPCEVDATERADDDVVAPERCQQDAQVQLLMRGVVVAGVEARLDVVQMAGVVARRLLQHEDPRVSQLR
jgi:hypothetical protein